MPSDIDDLAAALDGLQGVDTGDNADAVPPGRRACPICGQHMQVEAHDSIAIDICPRHGIWLDNGELPALLARARGDRAAQTRRRIRKAKRDGKVSGALFGVWSLLLD